MCLSLKIVGSNPHTAKTGCVYNIIAINDILHICEEYEVKKREVFRVLQIEDITGWFGTIQDH